MWRAEVMPVSKRKSHDHIRQEGQISLNLPCILLGINLMIRYAFTEWH